MNWMTKASAAAGALLIGAPASAQVYGNLANFDVVNDTGHACQGFEVEIEDASYDRSKILSVFGLDRNFGVPPTSVERYGAPSITDVPGFGVRVRYQARFTNGAWTTQTPSGPYPDAGEACWIFGNPRYDSGDLSCDHFGISTYGTPALVHYRWLCDMAPGGNSGELTPVPAEVPPVQFTYQPQPPPAPGEPQLPEPVQIEIDAPDEPEQPDDVFGRAYWVKIYSRHSNHPVALDALMVDNPEVPGDDEVEIEWELFQEGGDLAVLQNEMFRDPADRALVLRFAFYEYVGPVKADGEVDCSGRRSQPHAPENCGGLGDYVGAQMAAFDVAPEPVPDVPLFAHSIGTLGLAGLAHRRFRKSGRTRSPRDPSA